MPFCPNCKALLYPNPDAAGMICRSCKTTTRTPKTAKIMDELEPKEQVVLEDDAVRLPKTQAECPKCGHMEAYWLLRQTRSSDEPETTFLTCVKCKHRWRKY